ncbi:hypothetical protein OXPF_02530 [Oxobacter pfennigii]|uniref:DUF3788 domain-containing protein n=1 Tax=Oxobacter pfennigii TaxID=36849 RepID=A0A0P8WEI4_9CLOT|nr:DUF3788 family protein [Oxobacter pfennigii]KPU46143.1 hypothetical protein OXPF_02530 [Oxobacter pfennigii]
MPSYDEIRDFIGDIAVMQFDRLIEFVEENYDFDKEIYFGGKNYGVLVRFRKNGKTLLSIFPEKNGFSIVLVYGKKEIEQFENRKNEYSSFITSIYDATKQYHDGKWLLIRIEDDRYLNELIEMIKIKKKPNKKVV